MSGKRKNLVGAYQKSDRGCNCRLGPCGNDCRYCAIATYPVCRPNWRKLRRFKDAPRTTRPDVDNPKHFRNLRGKVVQFPTMHDFNTVTDAVVGFMWVVCLLVCGAHIMIHTKGRYTPMRVLLRLMAQLPEEYRKRIQVRITVGSSNNWTLSAWEPKAPPYHERRASLQLAYRLGFKTVVAITPMLDGTAAAICRDLGAFATDGFWIGMMVKHGRDLLFNKGRMVSHVKNVRKSRRDSVDMSPEVQRLYDTVYTKDALVALEGRLLAAGHNIILENEVLITMGRSPRDGIERGWMEEDCDLGTVTRPVKFPKGVPAWAFSDISQAWGWLEVGLAGIIANRKRASNKDLPSMAVFVETIAEEYAAVQQPLTVEDLAAAVVRVCCLSKEQAERISRRRQVVAHRCANIMYSLAHQGFATAVEGGWAMDPKRTKEILEAERIVYSKGEVEVRP